MTKKLVGGQKKKFKFIVSVDGRLIKQVKRSEVVYSIPHHPPQRRPHPSYEKNFKFPKKLLTKKISIFTTKFSLKNKKKFTTKSS